MSALDHARLLVAALALTAGVLAAVRAPRDRIGRRRLLWAAASSGFFYAALVMTASALR